MDLLVELGLVGERAAFEVDAGHGRGLDDLDDERSSAPLDAHVGKQAGGVQRLDRLIGLGWIIRFALGELELRAQRVRLDGAGAGKLEGRARLLVQRGRDGGARWAARRLACNSKPGTRRASRVLTLPTPADASRNRPRPRRSTCGTPC